MTLTENSIPWHGAQRSYRESLEGADGDLGGRDQRCDLVVDPDEGNRAAGHVLTCSTHPHNCAPR